MRPVTLNPTNVAAALTEIERASHENDIVEVAQNYSLTGTLVPTRVLNVAAPTAANVAAVLATLLDDLKKGGLNRTT